MGLKSGVATKLQSYNNLIISVHCVCHRLALASSQASSEVKKFKDYLLALYNLFHNSSVKSARLKQVQEVFSTK